LRTAAPLFADPIASRCGCCATTRPRNQAVSLTFSWRAPVSPALVENATASAPMTKSVAEYLDCARRFDRFAMIEPHVEVKRLLSAQIDACYRLAERRARETNAPIPVRPIGLFLVASPGIGSLSGNEGSGTDD
jgi:hypothetical protein